MLRFPAGLLQEPKRQGLSEVRRASKLSPDLVAVENRSKLVGLMNRKLKWFVSNRETGQWKGADRQVQKGQEMELVREKAKRILLDASKGGQFAGHLFQAPSK